MTPNLNGIPEPAVLPRLERFSQMAEIVSAFNELEHLFHELRARVLRMSEEIKPAPPIRIVKVRPEPADVIVEVARLFDLPTSDLIGKSRRRRILDARHTAFWFAWVLSGCSQEEVGIAFGDLNHSTVTNGIQKIRRLFSVDVRFRVRHREIEGALCKRFHLDPDPVFTNSADGRTPCHLFLAL